MKKYYILKQLLPGSPVWVAKLDSNDTIYEYSNLSMAQNALNSVKSNYPNNECKVGQL
jgi:hypothetical protein